MEVTHFCAGCKTQHKMKGKPFTCCGFFSLKSIWYSRCAYTQWSNHSLHSRVEDRMPLKQPVTDRSLRSTNLTYSQDCHTSTLVSNPPQHTTPSLCWLDTMHRRLPRQCSEQLWACRAAIGVLSSPPLVLGVRCPKAGSGSWEPDVLYCQTAAEEMAADLQKDATDAACFLYSCGFSLSTFHPLCVLWPVMGGGFSVTCFLTAGNGRGQVSVMEVLPPMSMFAGLQPALVPSGYSPGNVMGTDTSNVHFKVQLCSAGPRQS